MMTTVVQSSSSVSSTFLSTLDHLPCDIVRSLWVVQSCNLAVEKEKQSLHELFQKHPYQQENSPEDAASIAQKFSQSRKSIARGNKESVAELESLHAQLQAHYNTLKGSLDQLESDIHRQPPDVASQNTLRQQLKEHYEKNPLTSRVEALQERVLKELGKVIIKQSQGGATGIRIILNLSKKKGDKGRRAAKSEARVGKKGKKKKARGSAALPHTNMALASSVPEPEYIEPVVADPEVYCFCKQPSFGNMIGCDNDKCKNGEWFHYKCVGILNRVEALKYGKEKWYCSSLCKEEAETKKPKKKRRKGRSKW